MMMCRGVRGATTIENDTREEIVWATGELLELMVEANGINSKDVASAIFTTSPDLVSEYPALAARHLGWTDTPLLCAHEMAVPHGLKKCIRILVHWNTSKSAGEIKHVYINGAADLRPDIEALKDLDDMLTKIRLKKGVRQHDFPTNNNNPG